MIKKHPIGFAVAVGCSVFLAVLVSISGGEPKASTRDHIGERSERRSAADGRVPSPIKIADLLSDYSTNEIAADTKWSGNTVQVDGYVADIGKGIVGDSFVVLSSHHVGGRVHCSLESKSIAAAASLRKGQVVTAWGTVDGLHLGSVVLGRCNLGDWSDR